MGQYYKAVLKRGDDLKSYQSGEFKKLTESAWLYNNFVNYVVKMLARNPARVIWAGDYDEKDEKTGKNLYDIVGKPKPVSDKTFSDRNVKAILQSYPYLLNVDKKEYVEVASMPFGNDGSQMHPLPLLTVKSTGSGGGDYSGADEEYVGRWAGDFIVPLLYEPEGFELISPAFIEFYNITR